MYFYIVSMTVRKRLMTPFGVMNGSVVTTVAIGRLVQPCPDTVKDPCIVHNLDTALISEIMLIY